MCNNKFQKKFEEKEDKFNIEGKSIDYFINNGYDLQLIKIQL